MRQLLRALASSTSHNSLAAWFRRRRFALFRELVASCHATPLTILDIGGWQEFWEIVAFTNTPHKIILLNTYSVRTTYPNFVSVVGDARRLTMFEDQSIDIVFSNSVIEHLGTFENQFAMAREVERVGKKYYIQTPSYAFPIEPHFLFPCYHWLPLSWRAKLLARFSLGFIERTHSEERAYEVLREFRLLTKSEVARLFPSATIYAERILGIPKSYIAIKH